MKTTQTPVAAQLTWSQVHAHRLRRHHLDRRAAKKDIARVVGDIGGAQAQVMSAAELQIAVRASCSVADVRRALWADRAIVKTWLMRGTLHLARAEDLALYTAAMSRRWISVNKTWLKFVGVTEAEVWELVDEIGAALDGTPRTREELIVAVGRGKSARVLEALRSGWGGMLKPAARNGVLCFGPSRGQSVTFVQPRAWLRSWRGVDPEEAIVEVARRYLRAYGPATRQDFARWWGAWPGVGSAGWSGLTGELVPVSVEGARLDALADDLDAMREASVDDHVHLLPLFDPYLLGHATRDHLFDRVHAPKVSRTAGWISAVVLVNGVVVATWTHAVTKGRLRIEVTPFERLSAQVRARVRERGDEIAGALGASTSDVRFG